MVGNDLIELRAEITSSALALTVAARRQGGPAFVPVLVRIGENATCPALRAEIPEGCTLAVDDSLADSALLVVRGSLGEASFSLVFRLWEASPWITVSELLTPGTQDQPVNVDWMEAVWRVADWSEPGEVFSPVLVPEEGDVVGRHVMRAPALIAQCQGRAAALIGSVDSIGKTQALPACMNLLREDGTPILRTGLRPHRVRGHVYYESVSQPAHQAQLHHEYHLYAAADVPAGSAMGAARGRLWSGYGTRWLRMAPAWPASFEEYARQVYPRVLGDLWAETVLGGRRVGAIRINRSYANDVWMSPWFSQIRSAYGLYFWGQRLGEEAWVQRALATRDLHLAAPQDRGLFPTVFVFGETPEQCRWVHSHHQGGGPGIYHLFDMSWTVYQLLRWHRDLLPDPRTLEFARQFARGIVALQRPDGSLPAYVDAVTFAPVQQVDRQRLLADLEAHPGGDPYVQYGLERMWETRRFLHSAEDAASLLVLAELARLLPQDDPDLNTCLAAAGRIADWLARWALESGRWIDFEVYYSCSPKPLDFYDSRSGQWPQNTLCMHAAAAAYLTLYEVTGQEQYLPLATRALDRLSLYQQVWDPPFLNFYGFGGYGVMNTDGEWSDARQCQFADTHLDFHRIVGDQEHLERAVAACRAGLVTLFLPVSAPVYPTGWDRYPLGMAAENHAHGGRDHLCGVSGFDWGAGSALATAAYFRLRGVDA